MASGGGVRGAGAWWRAIAALTLVLALLVTAAGVPSLAAAATLTVTSGADAGGTCPGADCTLRQAIAAANAGDTITFAAGVTTVTLTSTWLTVDKNLTIQGSGVGGVTIRRSLAGGTSEFLIVVINVGVTATLAGLTLTNGSNNFGGGLYNDGILTLTDVVVSDNHANIHGGGIFNDGPLTMTNVTITGNAAAGSGGGLFSFETLTMTGGGIGDNDAASNGGGLYVAAGTATLTNGEVNGNDADNGGGLYLATGAATLIGSTVSGNEVRAIPGGGDGGGLYVAGGELTLTGSTVSDNTAQYGGGLYLAGGEATLTNCTVNDNNADISGGGGLYIDSGIEATLTGTTVSGNSAQGGGGIGNDGLLTLTNSTVSGNTAVFTGGIDNGGTLTLTHSTVSGNSALAHGGGLGVSGGGATTLRGSIVAGNTGGDCHTLSSGTYTSNGYNVVGSGGGCPSGGTGDLADSGGISSLLGILFDNGGPTKTHGLPILSPARDRIPAAQCGAASGVDQRGVARPQGPGCDSGAVELPYHTLIIGPPPFLTEYPEGTVVALTPLPDTGQTFVGWTVDGVAKGWAGTLTITMDDDHTVEGAYVATKTFADVGPGRVDYAAIVELASRGTILGFNATTYGPDQGVQRAQMAALIARAMPEGPGTPTFGYVAPPACAVAGTWDCEDWGNSFTDQGGIVASLWRDAGTLQHYQVAFGYTAADCQARGRAFPCYGPTDPVSHAQTIAFITRAMIVKGYWVAQPNAPLPYAGVPGVLATEVRTFHYYTGGVPDAPGSASGWNGGATRGWFARALWAALDSYWGVDGDLPDQRPAGGYVP